MKTMPAPNDIFQAFLSELPAASDSVVYEINETEKQLHELCKIARGIRTEQTDVEINKLTSAGIFLKRIWPRLQREHSEVFRSIFMVEIRRNPACQKMDRFEKVDAICNQRADPTNVFIPEGDKYSLRQFRSQNFPISSPAVLLNCSERQVGDRFRIEADGLLENYNQSRYLMNSKVERGNYNFGQRKFFGTPRWTCRVKTSFVKEVLGNSQVFIDASYRPVTKELNLPITIKKDGH